jgi:uncharacterized membrane protein HdeD (DUF308 family)
MLTQLSRNWWAVVLRGVLAILFGILAFAWPAITLQVLVLFFGAYALVDGVFALIAGLSNRVGTNRWWVVLEGLVGIVVGILAFLWPGLTAFALLYLIAAWAIVTGILEIMAAIELRKEISNEWLLILSGILSVIFGVLIALFPRAGALSIIWLIAIYAIVFGIMFVALGLRLRGWNRTMHSGTPAAGSTA